LTSGKLNTYLKSIEQKMVTELNMNTWNWMQFTKQLNILNDIKRLQVS